MSSWRIRPSKLEGSIEIPSSKSETMRALLLGLMGHGLTRIEKPLISSDTLAMVAAIHQFGAHVNVHDKMIEVHGVGGEFDPIDRKIDAGNSGIVLRFIGALAGLSSGVTEITGDHSVRHYRPVLPLIGALQQLGATASTDGTLRIQGPMQAGYTRLVGTDSQPVSGLLIATSFLSAPTEMIVDNPGETPWIDLTLQWMQRVGLRVDQKSYTRYRVEGQGHYKGFCAKIPGDLSALAFPLVAALVTRSSLTITGVDMQACQGDKRIVEIVQQMGALVDVQPEQVHVGVTEKLRGIELDINDCIDALPILAVLGCYSEGVTRLVNGEIARHKESDRIAAIAQELRKMGAQVFEKRDGLEIWGRPLKGARVYSHADHRIAMAMAVSGLGASGETTIEGVECVSKSYPTFFQDLQKRMG